MLSNDSILYEVLENVSQDSGGGPSGQLCISQLSSHIYKEWDSKDVYATFPTWVQRGSRPILGLLSRTSLYVESLPSPDPERINIIHIWLLHIIIHIAKGNFHLNMANQVCCRHFLEPNDSLIICHLPRYQLNLFDKLASVLSNGSFAFLLVDIIQSHT